MQGSELDITGTGFAALLSAEYQYQGLASAYLALPSVSLVSSKTNDQSPGQFL
jgi:hypothetical protein